MCLNKTLKVLPLLIILILITTSCQKKVSVRTGEIVQCRYGHVIAKNVKTLRVPQSDIAKYRVRERVKVCSDHAKTENLYSQAQKAIKHGDNALAYKKLKEILKIDPEFRDAAQVLAMIAPNDSKDKVTVKTGTRTVCTHGEIISENVKEISVLASDAGKYSVVEVKTICSKHKQADDLYRKAQQMLADGNKASAQAYLRQALDKDPGLTQAQEQLASLTTEQAKADENKSVIQQAAETVENTVATIVPGSSSGSSDSGTSTGSTQDDSNDTSSSDDGSQSSPSINLADRIPKTITDCRLVASTKEEIMATAMFIKNNKVFISFQIKQHIDGQDAKKEIERSSQNYSESNSAETVKGNDGTFGTDGREFAYLGWAEGAVSYEIEMSDDDQEPEDLRNDILEIAKLTK